ncbi:MAG: hypothetical protein Kow0025_21850 [Thermodesulfovibrionales bacterium]
MTILAAVALGALILLAGCGSSNPQASFDPQTDHPADFLPERHAVQAAVSIDSCATCHGDDFSGGISGVACTNCHLGDEVTIHPAAWADLAAVRHGPFVEQNGNSSCSVAVCHGAALGGVQGSGPSCTLCHVETADDVHPVAWGDFDYGLHGVYVFQNGTGACENAACHGASLGGVAESGPSCTSCHLGGVFSFHPVEWDQDFLLHADFVTQNGASSCRNAACHGANLQGVVLSGPPCSLCHTNL